jgi:AhpD family alkylhydroperoxidase
MQTLMPFLSAVMGESSLDLATKELVIVRVSQLNGCRYCLAAHRPLALEAGLSAEHVDAICEAAPLETLPDRERALVAWADQVTRDARGVTDELVARMLDWLREDQLVELTVLAGTITMLNAYCTAFDIPPPDSPSASPSCRPEPDPTERRSDETPIRRNADPRRAPSR